MRKLLPVVLGIFLLVAASVYTIAWVVQGMQLKAGVEAAIAQLNTQISPGKPVIEYASLDLTGFPGDVTVRVVKPRISGDVSPLMQLVAPPQEGTAPPPWNMEMAWDGSLDFSINIFSDRVSVASAGAIRSSEALGAIRRNWLFQSEGPMVCALRIQPGNAFGAMWSIKRFIQQGHDMFSLFRAFECRQPAYSLIDEDSKEELAQGGGAFIHVSTLIPGPDRRSARILAQVKDAVYTAKFGEAMQSYSAYFPSMQRSFTADWSAYGKQNVLIEATYDGPGRKEDFNLVTPFVFEVKHLDFSNALYSYTFRGGLLSQPTSEKLSLAIKMDTVANFTPAFDTNLRDMLRSALDQGKAEQNPLVTGLLNERSVESVLLTLEPVLFKPGEFSPAELHLDLAVQGEQANPQAGTLTVNRAELSLKPYGVTAHGVLRDPQKEGQFLPPSSKMEIVCRNCERMIADAASYAQRLSDTLGALDDSAGAGPQEPLLPPGLPQGVQQFLTQLAAITPDAATGQSTYRYDITSDEAGNVSVNGKDFATVQQLHQQYILPYLPQADVEPTPDAPQ